MSVKNCGVDIEITSLQDEINLLNAAVVELQDDSDHDEALIEVNGASIAQLNTNVMNIGGIYGVPISGWSTQSAGFISIPNTTGTWLSCFNGVDLNLPVNGTYMVSLNFMTFINNDNIGHNPITVGCELFQGNLGLATNLRVVVV